MKKKNTDSRSRVAPRTQYPWVAATTLIVALLLTAFAGISPVAADSDSLQRGIDADAARYQAWAEADRARASNADSARWAALGTFYTHGSAEQPYTDVSLFYVERMRAQARGSSILVANSDLPYTDVSLFYVERMRAQARGSSTLAAEPRAGPGPPLLQPELGLLFARRCPTGR